MIKYYLKTTFRNLLRNRFYSAINIVGLSIGITACILIMLYVQFELSYDKFNEKADRIYRVNGLEVLNGDNYNLPHTSPPLAGVMKDEIPEVEEAVRLTHYWPMILEYKDKILNVSKTCFADPNFFKIFSTSFIYGDPSTALLDPYSVVLTETTAKRYFGNENPIGQTLSRKNYTGFTVTGVIEDFPENSDIKPDFIGSFKSRSYNNSMNWFQNSFYTYVLLKEGFSNRDVDEKLKSIVKKYVGPYVKEYKGVSLEELMAKGNRQEYYTQPLTEIHLDNTVKAGLEPLGNSNYLIIFSIIAVFILVIACINYMNMSTAQSVNRAREVGLKKSLGSNRKKLVLQFLSESVLITLAALTLAMILIKIFLPAFNALIDKQLVFNYMNDFGTIPLFLVLGIAIGILAGAYPAFFLASFDPIKVLKGIHFSDGSHGKLRSGLVVFQLIVTIVLFSGTFFISKQLNFLQEQKLGFNKENMVIIENTNYLGPQLSLLKNELLAQPGVLQVTNSNGIPGRDMYYETFAHDLSNVDRHVSVIWTDVDFLKAYDIELTQGRFFEEGNQANAKSIVLNETALKELNIKDPIGKKIYKGQKTDATTFTIIGVIKDFHFESLHKEVSPLGIYNNNEMLKYNGRFLSVRISGDIQKNLKKIQQIWDKFTGGQSFDYVFLDEDFGRLYTTEVRTRKIVSVFSALAILIACIGLLALAAFVAEQRTKEIGVRKVNGARIGQILYSLNRNFMKWVVIAFVISCPIAYYTMNKWLQDFAYKTSLSWWVFALAGLAALVITIITVSWISWRAATRNPVEALRYE
ncbi:ABC transporter permease [Maribellus maritimus]|uniref:ABC transporter permease n=1 Tax=Maribellus maritimus TaxID=2870838 RepID=UPI001EEA6B02|nr:ABC transporter permease [Maribellus maritimus]MCG6189818.1 ABC transporter permease [Maribellus maritimus]